MLGGCVIKTQASEVNLALDDESEVLVADTSTNVIMGSVGGGNAFNVKFSMNLLSILEQLVAEATVQALKKPTQGFGAERKFDTEKKGMNSQRQLKRSRWSLLHLLRTFNPSQLLPVVNSQNLSWKSPVMLEIQSEDPPAEPSAREDDPAEPSLEMDKQDEPMSRSDLSTSFQECLQSGNKNTKPGTLKKS
ncbi:hypothetical protein Pint_20016 [Pistacia integerrima]|uniref:Uncharacterized protein n=1 Tax=Pistacia integerrima TaxID=434235 RepID=A0ACC0XBU0_9ROSI|nr:hypothetical protein Pint_20016 [Pistacia integerrima]